MGGVSKTFKKALKQIGLRQEAPEVIDASPTSAGIVGSGEASKDPENKDKKKKKVSAKGKKKLGTKGAQIPKVAAPITPTASGVQI